MDSLKWIKLSTDVFSNRKIQYIETMPDADTILVIWFKILALAGSINDCGQVYLTKEIPYTEEMMAAKFQRPLNTVRLALQLFEQLDMIEVVDDIMRLTNWEKYQGAVSIETVREQTRIRTQAWRARKKEAVKMALLEAKNDCDVTVTLRDAVEKKRIEENRKEKNVEEESEKEEAPSASRTHEPRHQYGEYKNVLLSDRDVEKLKNEFPEDWQRRIDDLSYYKARTGRTYKNDMAAIRSWARSDANRTKPARPDRIKETENMLKEWAEEEETNGSDQGREEKGST